MLAEMSPNAVNQVTNTHLCQFSEEAGASCDLTSYTFSRCVAQRGMKWD